MWNPYVYMDVKLGLSQRKFSVKYKPLWIDVLRYILRIWWPNIISNKDLWKVTGQEDLNVEIRKRKFRWIGHTLRKEDGEITKLPYFGTLRETGREEDREIAGEDPGIKEAGRSWNELRFLAADRQKWKGLIDNLCS